MKHLKYIIAFFLLSAIFSGCNDLLNILPDDKPTLKDAFKDAYNAEKFLFTCYGDLPPVANPNTTLGLTGGGEILYLVKDGYVSMPATMQSWLYGNFANDPLMNFWDGAGGAPKALWQGIRNCNIFLENIPVENGGPKDVSDSKRARWIGEAKVLKAYLHFYLFRLYGPIPIIDKVIPISDKDLNVYRAPVNEVVGYIAKLIDEAVPDLPLKSDMDASTEFGRINRTIALCIKAKALVWAASPIFNNNNYYANVADNRGVKLFPTVNSAQLWERALNACDSACRAAENEGASIYISEDGGDNAITDINPSNIPDTLKYMINLRQAVTKLWNDEIIWGTNESTWGIQMYATMLSNAEWNNAAGAGGSHLGQRHGPFLAVVERFYSSNGIPIEEDEDWQNNGWYRNRYNTQTATDDNAKYLIKAGEETAILHFNRSYRFYASVGFDGGLWEGRSKTLEETSFPNFQRGTGCGYKEYGTVGAYSATGYLAKKLSHLKTKYSDTRITLSAWPYSFPIIRLADMYLLMAESLNEAGGPAKTDSRGRNAVSYLDEIRERVGINGVVESWGRHASGNYKNKPASKEGLRDIIRRERMNELAFEGSFYYDVRRWLTAEKLLNQSVKGWDTEADTKSGFYNVIFKHQPRFSMKDYLMPLKISTLLQNRNLVQNPGW